MIGEIRRCTPEQLRALLQRGWTRAIAEVHIHHTWRPTHDQWRGERTVRAKDPIDEIDIAIRLQAMQLLSRLL
jgi:hypothetical protein